MVIELDDGKIETGKPYDLDGKTHGFPVFRFSQENQSIELVDDMEIGPKTGIAPNHPGPKFDQIS
jgi:hypothetical protein